MIVSMFFNNTLGHHLVVFDVWVKNCPATSIQRGGTCVSPVYPLILMITHLAAHTQNCSVRHITSTRIHLQNINMHVIKLTLRFNEREREKKNQNWIKFAFSLKALPTFSVTVTTDYGICK